jgi:hypothetical protein
MSNAAGHLGECGGGPAAASQGDRWRSLEHTTPEYPSLPAPRTPSTTGGQNIYYAGGHRDCKSLHGLLLWRPVHSQLTFIYEPSPDHQGQATIRPSW